MDCRVRKVVSLTGLLPGFLDIQVSFRPWGRPTEQALLSDSPRLVHKRKLRPREIRALARGDSHGEKGARISAHAV